MKAWVLAPAAVGYAALSLSYALVARELPLRLSLPATILFCALFAISRKFAGRYVAFAGAYAAFWMVAGSVAAHGQHVALLLLLGGLAALVPCVPSGVKAMRANPHCLDFGVIGGAGFLSLFVTGMTLLPGGPEAGAPIPLAVLLAGGLVVWLAMRGATASGIGVDPRLVMLSALVITALAVLVGTGCWALSGFVSRQHAAKGETSAAQRWALVEQEWAERLAVRPAILASLRRQARIARDGGNAIVLRNKLRKIAALAPADFETWQQLLSADLERDDRRGALEAFAHLPDAYIAPQAAARMAAICAWERDLAGFTKAWRASGGRIPQDAEASVPWLDWGKLCYFKGQKDLAEAFLSKDLAACRQDWPSVRLLWSMYKASGQIDKAGALVEQAPALPGNRVEALYLRAEIARLQGDAVKENRLLKEVLSIDPGYDAARERAAGKPGSSADAQLGSGPAVIGDTLRLLDGRILTPTARAGARAELLFRWQALAPVDPSWRVFVHIRRRLYGGFLFKVERRFSELGRLPEEWAIGTAFAYKLDVPIPGTAPAGEYTVAVGILDRAPALPATDGRVPAGSSGVQGGQILVGRLMLLPQE